MTALLAQLGSRVPVTVAILALLLTTACGNDSPTAPDAFDIPTLTSTDVVVGTGAEAANGRIATVHYTLYLYSPTAPGNKGQRLQSSRDLNQPFSFTVGARQVITGWDQGVPGMRVGGQRTLQIPSSLAYGRSGSSDGSIPPNSAIVFDIELLNVQ